MLVALPAIIVWGLGIPFLALVMISRLRNKLDTLESRSKFGFFYRGYKRQYYYWEILIMYRKIVLIFLSEFIVNDGIITQVNLRTLMLIIGTLDFHITCRSINVHFEKETILK